MQENRVLSNRLSPRVPGIRNIAWFWAGVAVLSAFAIFVLPFSFPPAMPSFSPAYEAGFNNRVAAVATALISVAVALHLWSRRAGAPVREGTGPLPRWWLRAATLAAILFTAVLGIIVVRGDTYFGDAGYFITQLTHALYDPHAALYRDIEFPYGPLMFAWPMLFIKSLGQIGVRPEAAYMVSLACMHVLGLTLLFYLLGKLPLSRAAQRIAFITLTLGSLSPILGLNYTMFRFTLPYAGLLWIAGHRTLARQALLFFLGEIFMLAVSSELGIAFAAGAFVYGLYLALTSGPRWLSVSFIPPVGFVAFAASVGKDYFRSFGAFASGIFNSVVDPSRLHIDILILSAVAVTPFAVAGYVRSNPRGAAVIVGMYGASLAMLPSALGRCDALHTFFNGIGLALLALLAVDACNGLWPRVWLGLFVFSALWSQATQSARLLPQLRNMLRHPATVASVDVARLQAATRGERISAPVDLPLSLRRELMQDGQYEPSHYCGMAPDRQEEAVRLAEMQRAPFALLPVEDYTMRPDVAGAGTRSFLNYGHRFKLVHTQYVAGALIEQELHSHWIAVSTFGGYVLYRHRETARPSPD